MYILIISCILYVHNIVDEMTYPYTLVLHRHDDVNSDVMLPWRRRKIA